MWKKNYIFLRNVKIICVTRLDVANVSLIVLVTGLSSHWSSQDNTEQYITHPWGRIQVPKRYHMPKVMESQLLSEIETTKGTTSTIFLKVEIKATHQGLCRKMWKIILKYEVYSLFWNIDSVVVYRELFLF